MKAVEFSNAEKAKKKFWTKQKMGLAAVALVFAGSNLDEIDRWSQFNSQGPMVLAPPGCEVEYALPEQPDKAVVEKSMAQTRSAARNFSASTVDLQETVRQGYEMESQFLKEFVMPQSGIRIALHGPDGLEVDQDVFSELFHAPLMLDEEYSHPEIRQLVACYREAIIDNRKFEGITYDFYIKDEIGFCIEGLRFQRASEIDECDGNESAPPKIELELLNLKLFEKYTFFLSSSSTDPDQANRTISRLLLHGSIHAHGVLLDQPLRLDPDEQLADRVERVTTRVLYPEGVPIALAYPSNITVSMDDQG